VSLCFGSEAVVGIYIVSVSSLTRHRELCTQSQAARRETSHVSEPRVTILQRNTKVPVPIPLSRVVVVVVVVVVPNHKKQSQPQTKTVAIPSIITSIPNPLTTSSKQPKPPKSATQAQPPPLLPVLSNYQPPPQQQAQSHTSRSQSSANSLPAPPA
jgi:hypothetical protein